MLNCVKYESINQEGTSNVNFVQKLFSSIYSPDQTQKRTLQKTNTPLHVCQNFRVVHIYIPDQTRKGLCKRQTCQICMFSCLFCNSSEFGKYLNISQKSMRTRTNSQRGHKYLLCPGCHKIFYCT